MNDTFEKIEGLTEHVKEYVQTRIQQTKLEVAEKTSGIIGNIIAFTVVAVLFLFVVVFGSIAGAWALSEWIGKTWAGFLIVAGFYLLLAIIVWLGRAGMIRFPVMNAIIKELNKEKDDDDDDEKVEPAYEKTSHEN